MCLDRHLFVALYLLFESISCVLVQHTPAFLGLERRVDKCVD
jgi:hypothetical protein